VCIWEAESVDAVRNVLEPVIGRVSRNEYFTVENREGFARPSGIPQTAAAGAPSGGSVDILGRSPVRHYNLPIPPYVSGRRSR
jgi:hypothetical protein